MENKQSASQGQSQSSQSQTLQQGNIPANGQWHDFAGPVASFKSTVACEIEPLSGTFGRVRSLDTVQQNDAIEVNYQQG